MAAAQRQAVITVTVDLAKHSKEAHMVTVEKIGKAVGQFAQAEFEGKGYTVKAAKVSTLLHYVRHNKTVVLKAVKKTTSAGLRRVI